MTPKLTPDQLHDIREANARAQFRARTTGEVRKQDQHLAKVAKYVWPLLDHVAHLEAENAVLRAGRSRWPQ